VATSKTLLVCIYGATESENVGRENNGRSKSRGMKMQDMEMQDLKCWTRNYMA